MLPVWVCAIKDLLESFQMVLEITCKTSKLGLRKRKGDKQKSFCYKNDNNKPTILTADSGDKSYT